MSDFRDLTDKIGAEAVANLTIASLRAQLAAARAEGEAATHHLNNLLARIHGDGGHYSAEHGLEKASGDADAVVIADRVQRDRYAEGCRLATLAINALMDVGCLLQNDRGTWKVRKPHEDVQARVNAVNAIVPIARAALKEGET